MLLLLPAVFAASWAGTWLIMRAGSRIGRFDFPNDRSLHELPTPRGGGLAFVVAILGSIAYLAATASIPRELAAAFLGGGALVALVGFLDDRKPLANAVRLPIWCVAGAWTAWWVGGLSTLSLGVVDVPLGAAGWILATLGVVWLINIYNFMDGIDGLAAGQAVVTGLAAAWVLQGTGAALLALVIAAGAAGFLLWNWPPARIFMGDVGSGFLGFSFAALALWGARADAFPIIGWTLLLGVFVVDTTLTLARRAVRGERWYEAHRTHAYQVATRAIGRHAPVTFGVLALGVALAVLGAVISPGAPLASAAAFALAVTAALWLGIRRGFGGRA